MANIKIPTGYDNERVLLADDEPEHLDWLVDYVKKMGCNTTIVTNVRDAINAIERFNYRAYFIDLNIPLGGWAPIPVTAPAYDDYHGLYIIKLVRSQGNSGSRVVAYSAHQNEQISSEIRRLYCRYVVKGRPRQLKEELDEILKKDPRVTSSVAKPRGRPNSRIKPAKKKK